MQCPFVNVYCEPQQWHCFEYLSVYYSKEEINIKQDFIPSSLCQVNYVHLLRLMTNINQILVISCNIRWILILTSERNKALTFLWEVLTTQMEYNSDFWDGIKFWLLRWIKYEEVLEPETGEWSNAHVSNLSFQSMIGLRCHLQTHAIPSINHTSFPIRHPNTGSV